MHLSSISTTELQQLSCVHCEKNRNGTNSVLNIVAGSKRGWKITVHHQCSCGPCVKCGKETDTRWAHGTVISLAVFEAIKKVAPVTNGSCICRICDAWPRRQAGALAKQKSNRPKSTEKKLRHQCSMIGFTELMHWFRQTPLTGHDKKTMDHPLGDQHGSQIFRQENERPRDLVWVMQSKCISKQLIPLIRTIYTAIKNKRKKKEQSI